MGFIKTYFGTPIPLHYISPNLQYYPLILPNDIVILKNINNMYEDFNSANIHIEMTYHQHVCFIKALMHFLQRDFIIFNNYLIDLSRKDFQVIINEKKNIITISDYKVNINVLYINEKYLYNKQIFNSTIYYNSMNTHNMTLLAYHCKRIYENTLQLYDFVVNSLTTENPFQKGK